MDVRHVYVQEGNFQSPINIETNKTVFDENLLKTPLAITYDPNACNRITNNGYTFVVEGHSENSTGNFCCVLSLEINLFFDHYYKVKGGPLRDEYNFLQLHMHWGEKIESGSEHLINGHPYAAEVIQSNYLMLFSYLLNILEPQFHFVNWNRSSYANPGVAMQSSNHDGLTILAVLVKIGRENEEFEKINKCMRAIHLKNQHADVDHLDLNNLLPSKQ